MVDHHIREVHRIIENNEIDTQEKVDQIKELVVGAVEGESKRRMRGVDDFNKMVSEVKAIFD